MQLVFLFFAITSAFAPTTPHHRLTIRRQATTAEDDIMAAFAAVKTAAAAFGDDTEEKKAADKLVDRLSKSHYSDWNPDDMVLIDKCLVENDDVCEAFCTAMTTLRELYDKSPGNA